MNKKGQVAFGAIILIFVGIIVAVALFGGIIDTQSQLTDKQIATNKSFDVSGAFVDATNVDSTAFTIFTQSDWKQIECPLTDVVLRNGVSTALVDNTDYILWEGNGTFNLITTAKTQPGTSLNVTYVDYTFCYDGYNTDGSSRSIARLIGLFAALALVAFVFIGIKKDLFS